MLKIWTRGSPWILDELRELARSRGLGRTVHLAQSEQVKAMSGGRTSAEYLDDHGWLGPDVLAAHWCSSSDVDLLARREINMVHCAASSSRRGYHQLADVPTLLDAGVNVTLSTDNMSEDMFDAMRIGIVVNRGMRGDGQNPTPAEVPGPRRPGVPGCGSEGGPGDVESVMVDGEWVMGRPGPHHGRGRRHGGRPAGDRRSVAAAAGEVARTGCPSGTRHLIDLQGAAAIVTGGNGGLGRRICRSLAIEGADVAVVYYSDSETADAVVSEARNLGHKGIAVRCDVSQPADVRAMVDETLDRLRRVDILVNNAAHYGGLGTHFLDMDTTSLKEWNRSLAVNLTGPMLCTRAVGPIMKEQGHGRVVNISAVGGFEASPYSTAYVVAKAALNHLTRGMAAALAPEVLVNCIAPGFMEETRATGLIPQHLQDSARANASLKRPISKDDVAAQVIELCRTDSTTGQTLVIDAGRHFP